MSFYGIETGLTSFYAGADKRPEDRAAIAKRVAERLRQLQADGVFVDIESGEAFDDDAMASAGLQQPGN